MACPVNWNGTEEQRFWRNVRLADSGCWEWSGFINENGYANFSTASTSENGGRKVKAHVWAYEKYVARIPQELDVDHLCRNRKCVNPLHLEAVTHRENVLRGEAPSAKAAKQTHCIHGHPFSEENTYMYHGMRYCKLCKSRRMKEYYERINNNNT